MADISIVQRVDKSGHFNVTTSHSLQKTSSIESKQLLFGVTDLKKALDCLNVLKQSFNNNCE